MGSTNAQQKSSVRWTKTMAFLWESRELTNIVCERTHQYHTRQCFYPHQQLGPCMAGPSIYGYMCQLLIVPGCCHSCVFLGWASPEMGRERMRER
jgi:hypothetical protein